MTTYEFLSKLTNVHRSLATEMFYAITFVCNYQGPTKQNRASGEPYLDHLAEVAWSVMCVSTSNNNPCTLPNEMLDDETIIAAILHDIIEDTDVTYDVLKKTFSKGQGPRFGRRVADLVMSTSKLPKSHFKGTEEEIAVKRSTEAFERWASYSCKDWQTIPIKVEDRVHNMRTLYGLSGQSDRQKRIAISTIEVLVPFLEGDAKRIVPQDYHGWLNHSIDELKCMSARYLPDYYEITISKIEPAVITPVP